MNSPMIYLIKQKLPIAASDSQHLTMCSAAGATKNNQKGKICSFDSVESIYNYNTRCF